MSDSERRRVSGFLYRYPCGAVGFAERVREEAQITSQCGPKPLPRGQDLRFQFGTGQPTKAAMGVAVRANFDAAFCKCSQRRCGDERAATKGWQYVPSVLDGESADGEERPWHVELGEDGRGDCLDPRCSCSSDGDGNGKPWWQDALWSYREVLRKWNDVRTPLLKPRQLFAESAFVATKRDGRLGFGARTRDRRGCGRQS